MPGPRSVPGAPLGKMKQQPLLLARVKCDKKIGEAAGGGAGGAQLGSAGRGVPWQRGFRPHPPTPHRRHQAPAADVPGSRGEVVIPTQPLPERARTGPGGIAQTQFSVILRAERRRAARGSQGRLPRGGGSPRAAERPVGCSRVSCGGGKTAHQGQASSYRGEPRNAKVGVLPCRTQRHPALAGGREGLWPWDPAT